MASRLIGLTEACRPNKAEGEGVHFWRSGPSIFSFLVSPSVIFHISFYNMDGVLVPKREAQFFSLFVSPDIIFLTSFYNMDGVSVRKRTHSSFSRFLCPLTSFSLLRFTTWMGYHFQNQHAGTFMHNTRHLLVGTLPPKARSGTLPQAT